MDVLLVAAKTRQDRRLHRRHQPGGRSAVVVDIDAFAVQNCFEANYGLDVRRDGRCSTPARRPSTSTSSRGEQSLFTRDISVGGNAYTDAVQREFGLPFEAAEHAKKGTSGRRRAVRGRPASAAHDERGRRSSRFRRRSTSSRPPRRTTRSTASSCAAAPAGSTAWPNCLTSASARRWNSSTRSRP